MTARVKGRRRLAAKLKRIPVAVRAATEDALRKNADELVAMQQRFAPVRTGRLRRSIVATYAGQSTPPHSQPGGRQVVPPLSVMVTAGNDEVRYAHLVEYGTAPHPNEGMFAGTEHPGAAPHPFFWPPYRALRKRMKSRVTREARKAIRKVVAG